VALVHELKPAGADQWENFVLYLCAQERELVQSWPFRTGQSCRSHLEKLIPKQNPTESTSFSSCCRRSRRASLGWSYCDGVPEELELENEHPLEQELLLTPPTKRSKQNISTIIKELWSRSRSLGASVKRDSSQFPRILFRVFLNPLKQYKLGI
jgi:hypothetical protein